MTRDEAKEKQAQLDALQAEITQYRKDVGAEMVLRAEDKYLGRMYIKNGHVSKYKKPIGDDPTTYLRVVSAIINEAGIRVHCIEFEPYTKPKFIHGSDFSMYRGNLNPYDYLIQDEPAIFTETEMIEDLEKYEEIDAHRFSEGLSTLCNNMIEFAKKTYKMEEYFGGHYVEEIRSKIAAEDKK